MATITYTVTVATGTNQYSADQNKYYINGTVSPTIQLQEGNTYIFDTSDSTNDTHIFGFSNNPNNSPASVYSPAGIVTTTGTSTNISGYGTTTTNFYENSNFLAVPDHVIGVNKIFKFDSSSISGGMFSIKYQLFLNDLYNFTSINLLQYAMTKTYLEDIDHLLTTEKQIRFNQRQDRLYLDIDWGAQQLGDFMVIDCFRALDPDTFTQVYNDPFIKLYLTALIKR